MTIILVVSLAVVIGAYATIIATTQRSPRELAWTLIPALLLALLVAVSTNNALAR